MCERNGSGNVLMETVHILPNERISQHTGASRSSDEDESANPKLTFGIDRLLSRRTNDRRQEADRGNSPSSYCASVRVCTKQNDTIKHSDSECCDECRGDSFSDNLPNELAVDPNTSIKDQFSNKTGREGLYQPHTSECSGDFQYSGVADNYHSYGLTAAEYDRRVSKLILKPLPVRVGHGPIGCGGFPQPPGVMTTFSHPPTTYLGTASFDNGTPFSIDELNNDSSNKALLPSACSKPRSNDYA
uniref:Uncharacterized protein n=1 Tax=Anopheles atroparvus TaxID=41427 RepID=A0AAG5CZV0_ANOAO